MLSMFVANAKAAECSFKKAAEGKVHSGEGTFVCWASKDLVRHEFNMSSVYSQFYALMFQRCLFLVPVKLKKLLESSAVSLV